MREIAFWFLFYAGLAKAQVITTVAGTTPVFPVGQLPAKSAPLRIPSGVAADAAQNVYIADEDYNIVARVAPNGILDVIAGDGRAAFSGDGGPAIGGSLNRPARVAVDAVGNVYIADIGNSRIRKLSAGTITTVAGNGIRGFSGDGGPATAASISLTYGVAVDSAGRLYFAEADSQRIRMISSGTITTVAGNGTPGFSGDGGPATAAALNYPTGVAVDSAGNIYIADADNRRIRKVSGGTITTFAGNGNAGPAGDGGPAISAVLSVPSSVAVDSAGNLYISDGGRIREVSGGIITTVAGNNGSGSTGDGGPATGAAFRTSSVAVDSNGNIYIADADHAYIRKVSGGTISTLAGNGLGFYSGDGGPAASALLYSPSGVAVDSVGNLYVADFGNHRIRKVSGGTITTIAGNGNRGFSGDGGPATSASLNGPVGLTLDTAGNLYIADTGNCRIRKVSGGTVTTVAGSGELGFSGDGGPATSAGLQYPWGVAVDVAGNLYIADTQHSRIRKVSGGTITTVAGNGDLESSGDGGPATAGAIGLPAAIAVDATGSLYVADALNSRVRKVSGGQITTMAGNGSQGFSGDGALATNARLSSPEGLAVDSAGSLYISDTHNYRVRKVSNGVITTVVGNGSIGFSGDGGPPATAELQYPGGIAVDAATNIFIADILSNRVREVLITNRTFEIFPASLGFSSKVGGIVTGAQMIILSSPVAGLSFTASASVNWLTLSYSTGTIPANLQVTADPSTLAAGTYHATLSITVPNAFPTTMAIPVAFTVQPRTPRRPRR